MMETMVLLKKHQVKREIKHKLMRSLPKDQLTLVTLSKQEASKKLKWEHSKEFELNGAMFDVIYTEVNGEKINYWCWPDTEESSLNQLLGSLAKQKHQSAEDECIKLQKLLTYTLPYNPVLNVFCTRGAINFDLISIHYQSIHSTPNTPPPLS